MNKRDLVKQLYKINAIKLGDFLLKSGARSPIYIDLRTIIAYPSLLRDVANIMWQQVQHLNYKLICGVAYTALPFATCLSLEHDIPMLICRKEQKDYGTKKRIEGVYLSGQHCLVFEDVITSAGSVIDTVNLLRQENLIIKDIAVFIDREQGGTDAIEKIGCKLHAVFTLSEILETLKQICNKENLSLITELM